MDLGQRMLLSTFTVNSTGNDAATSGTLPWAVEPGEFDVGDEYD